MVVRRSCRQPPARSDTIVVIDGDSGKKDNPDANDSNSDDGSANACAACGSDDQRVKVTCAACVQQFHLGCASPPLKRRPVLASAWRCSTCAEPEAIRADIDTRSSRRRAATSENKTPAATTSVDAKPAITAAALTSARGVRARVAKTADAPSATTARIDKSASDFEPPKKSRRTAAAAAAGDDARTQRGGAAAKSKRVKVPPPRASAKASTAHNKTNRRHASTSDDDASADDDQGGDSDSDFSAASESDDDEDGTSDASDSSASLRRVKKLPTLKAPAAKRAKIKTSPRPRTSVASANTPNGGVDDGADSMDLPNAMTTAADDDGTAVIDSDDELDVYTGPRYFVEYASNNRARCKQCEQKLVKGALRVGVRVKHSIFGLTTYFKHLQCTQMCWSTASELTAKERTVAAIATAAAAEGDNSTSSQPEPETKASIDAADSVQPISGFASLTEADQAIVRAHMEAIEAQGLLDERVEISEDAYNKKTRMVEKEPSPHLTVPLLPYQREALAWMTAQERSDYRGGILADEMGMGKTIQAIALILENVRQAKTQDRAVKTELKPSSKQQQSAKRELPRGGTLVVCPLVAVMQWKSEIERFVERNHLSIYVHHGSKRVSDAARIASFDIVLTTYSIIESEMRKTLGWEKVACRYCKRKYLPDKLVLHNKYFCGPNAKKTAQQDKQQSNRPKGGRKRAAGESDVQSDGDDAFYPKKPAPKTRGRPAAGGGGRGKGKASAKRAAESDDGDDDDDAPVTSRKSKATSPLHQVSWTRIVLDEAHYIKDRRNNTARGVFELKSEYKWCLTGTPLQNRIGELFSLIRFLQIKSYAYYHCTNCECQLLDFHFPNGKCELCDHTAMQHFSFFNKKIVIPIQAYGYVAEGKLAMLRLQNEVLQHILLRRTKQGRADDICLPPKLVRIRKDHLDERENDFYEAIYTQSQAQFNTYVSSGTLLNNYAHIFDLLIRLRQAVDHPYLVIFSKSNPALQLPVTSLGDGSDTSTMMVRRPVVEEKPLRSMQADDIDDERPCTICHEDIEDIVVAKCGHEFCRECVKEFIESLPVGADATCPSCSQLLTVEFEAKVPELEDVINQDTNLKGSDSAAGKKNSATQHRTVDLSRYHKSSILHRISDMHAFQTSTKIEALMQELELMRQHDPSGKAIIFSQFVNMLDIIEHRLHLGGVKCVKMSGNMTMDVRDRTIKAFREDSSVTAFLISLKAGGVALNLTIASHIFLMDPWWNPAAESQAIDRTHRLGQFKPIQATRFIIAGTVEERILKLQEKKRLIFEGTVGASVSAVCRLTAEDLRFLFSK